MSVHVSVKQDRDTNAANAARDVRLFRNGTMVWSHRGDLQLDSNGEAVLRASIDIVAGVNVLTAYAFNQDNVKGPTARKEISGDVSLRRPGLLYVVAVGVSRYKTPELNLDFSAADATLFANALGRGTAATRTVRAATLTDDLVTRENIMAALGVLAGGSKASLPRRLAVLSQRSMLRSLRTRCCCSSQDTDGRGKVIFTSSVRYQRQRRFGLLGCRSRARARAH